MAQYFLKKCGGFVFVLLNFWLIISFISFFLQLKKINWEQKFVNASILCKTETYWFGNICVWYFKLKIYWEEIKKCQRSLFLPDMDSLDVTNFSSQHRLRAALSSKLYIPSTLNVDLILWHTQLIVYAIKC